MEETRKNIFKEYYAERLREHGDNHLGVGWPRKEEAILLQKVMLGVIPPNADNVSLLDVGCGTGALLEFIKSSKRTSIRYAGLDNSQTHLDICRRKFPGVDFIHAEIFDDELILDEYDYIVINGIFTFKATLSHAEMFEQMASSLKNLFQHARHGMAFNMMTKHVDWERDDLFHVPFDDLARLLKAYLSRHFLFRSDYGPWQYTAYVYREPQQD